MTPEAAVEAAARGIVASLLNGAEFEMHRTWATGYARAALEAAAPHMLAEFDKQRKYDALDAISELGSDDPDENPYRSKP